MQGDTVPRTKRPVALAILTALGGVIGLLASLYSLMGSLAAGGLLAVFALIVLGASVFELAFGYGTWTEALWSRRPGLQAAGFAVAVALILLAFAISLTIPVRVTVEQGQPIIAPTAEPAAS